MSGRSTIARSRQLAGVIGPTLIVLGATEAFNMNIFVDQTEPVVYLNGTILFTAGLALVRAHNHWRWNWTLLVTLTGWTLMVGGLYRMVAPRGPQADASPATFGLLLLLVLAGAALTFQASREGMRDEVEGGR